MFLTIQFEAVDLNEKINSLFIAVGVGNISLISPNSNTLLGSASLSKATKIVLGVVNVGTGRPLIYNENALSVTKTNGISFTIKNLEFSKTHLVYVYTFVVGFWSSQYGSTIPKVGG